MLQVDLLTVICLARIKVFLVFKGSSELINFPSALIALLTRLRFSSLMVFFISPLTLPLGFDKYE